MENPLVAIILAILIGLIVLSVLYWTMRVIWNVMQSPVALALLVGSLALTTSLIAISAPPG